jgi:hypothetical protein
VGKVCEPSGLICGPFIRGDNWVIVCSLALNEYNYFVRIDGECDEQILTELALKFS